MHVPSDECQEEVGTWFYNGWWLDAASGWDWRINPAGPDRTALRTNIPRQACTHSKNSQEHPKGVMSLLVRLRQSSVGQGQDVTGTLTLCEIETEQSSSAQSATTARLQWTRKQARGCLVEQADTALYTCWQKSSQELRANVNVPRLRQRRIKDGSRVPVKTKSNCFCSNRVFWRGLRRGSVTNFNKLGLQSSNGGALCPETAWCGVRDKSEAETSHPRLRGYYALSCGCCWKVSSFYSKAVD